jgi:hypothetical protein
VAYRTRRAFRAQYELLLAASTFEKAAARLEARAGTLRRHVSRRLARDVEQARVALAEQLREFRGDTLDRLAPSDLLAGMSQLMQAYPADADADRARVAPSRDASRLGSIFLGKPIVCACIVAWAATAIEVVSRGITDRPSLVIAELAALLLTPIALFQAPPRDARTLAA